MAAVQTLEVVDAHGAGALGDCSAEWHRNVLRMVCGAISVEEVGMLELTIYGLTGLAAMLVVAFYFACADDFAPDREKPSRGPRKNTYLNDSQIIETATGNLGFRRTAGNQEQTVLMFLLQTLSLAETGPAAICSISCQSNRGQGEAFHG
jgi:hypothetical protein